jgi:hypothetical protein
MKHEAKYYWSSVWPAALFHLLLLSVVSGSLSPAVAGEAVHRVFNITGRHQVFYFTCHVTHYS